MYNTRGEAERITTNYNYPKLQLPQIYNNVRGEAERITPNYNYPKLQLPKLQLPQITITKITITPNLQLCVSHYLLVG